MQLLYIETWPKGIEVSAAHVGPTCQPLGSRVQMSGKLRPEMGGRTLLVRSAILSTCGSLLKQVVAGQSTVALNSGD